MNWIDWGINIHAPLGEEQVFGAFADAVGAGFTTVRVDFMWPSIEPEDGLFDWHRYDKIVEEAKLANVSIIANLSYSPSWATVGDYWSGVPLPDLWARFCTKVALRYWDGVDLWELWNEPNLPWHFAGSCDDYIERILIPGSNAIHAISGQRVGGPSLAHLRGWYRWLRKIAPHCNPNRPSGRLDVLTHHTYASSASRLCEKLFKRTVFRRWPCLWWLVEPSVSDVLRYCSRSIEGLWLTETGWDSNEIGDGGQAFEYGSCIGRLDSSPLEGIVFYELYDDPRFPEAFGIAGKPAWFKCREMLYA